MVEDLARGDSCTRTRRGGIAQIPTDREFQKVVDFGRDAADQPRQSAAGLFVPTLPVGMRRDGPVLERLRDQARENWPQAVRMLVVLFPIDADAAGVPLGEAFGERVTEVGG